MTGRRVVEALRDVLIATSSSTRLLKSSCPGEMGFGENCPISMSAKSTAFSVKVVTGGASSCVRELGAVGILFLSLLESFQR